MKKTIQRVLAAVILFAMILSGGFSEVGKVHAEKQQGTTKRAIYVVFDNSGSMYGDGNKAWSQATYALTINPVAVQTILSYMKEKFADERNSSGKLDFEHSYLRRQINELASIEYGKAGLSIFDVALLLKVSTPSAEFDKTVGKGIMREILTLIYEYAQTMVLEADLDGIYGKFVLEQFEMFDKNIDWYMDNWKDNFSDYINDLMRIAVSDIERKKLTDIYEKMRKIMKESSKKRG